MLEYSIYLIGVENDEVGRLVVQDANRLCYLTLNYRAGTLMAVALDYFEAFCQMRLRLEEENLIPFSYGVSVNVYPSEMCHEMGGFLAYKLHTGKNWPIPISSASSIKDTTLCRYWW